MPIGVAIIIFEIREVIRMSTDLTMSIRSLFILHGFFTVGVGGGGEGMDDNLMEGILQYTSLSTSFVDNAKEIILIGRKYMRYVPKHKARSTWTKSGIFQL